MRLSCKFIDMSTPEIGVIQEVSPINQPRDNFLSLNSAVYLNWVELNFIFFPRLERTLLRDATLHRF